MIKNFNSLANTAVKKKALNILEAGLVAAQPKNFLKTFVDKNYILLGKNSIFLSNYRKIFVIAYGKAADSMAEYVSKKIKVSKASKSTTEIQKPIKVTPSNKAVLSDDDNSVRIKSPIIGTAYLAPEPGGKKFIEVGDKIKKGQTVMIVEAMKTMNHIPSTNDGVVKEVLVKDGQPVEFGQSLVLLK